MNTNMFEFVEFDSRNPSVNTYCCLYFVKENIRDVDIINTSIAAMGFYVNIASKHERFMTNLIY